MPCLDVGVFLFVRNTHQRCDEIERRERHAFHDRVPVTGKELLTFQFAVEDIVEIVGPRPAEVRRAGILLQQMRRQFIAVQPHKARRRHQIHLKAPQPHVDHGDLFWRCAKEVWVGMQHFVVAAD